MLVESFRPQYQSALQKTGFTSSYFYGGAVFTEILADKYSVVTVYFRALAGCGLLYLREAWRLAEQPKKLMSTIPKYTMNATISETIITMVFLYHLLLI